MEEMKNKTDSAPDQGNNKKNHMVFTAIAVIVVLVFIGSFAWLLLKKPENNANDNANNNPPPLVNRDSCQQDSDCVLAQKYEGCCSTCGVEAMTMKSKEMAEQTRNKQCAIKDFKCPLYECKQSVEQKAVCEQNKCVTKTTPKVSNADLLVTPDKGEYQKEELVNIDVQSYKDVDIAISNLSVEQCAIEPGMVGECLWENADSDIRCPCGAMCEKTAYIIISSKGIKKITWDQYTDKIDSTLSGTLMACKMAGAGRYRFKIDYLGDARAGATQQLQTIYSSEFRIVEKSSTLSNTNTANINTPNPDQSAQYKIIGSFSSSGEASFIEKIGNTIFMTDISEGLLAIDVSNPEKPTLLSKIKIGNGGAYALAVNINGPYALVSGYGNVKVALVDITDPKNLRMMGEIDAKRSVQDMVLAGDYAYLAIDGPEVEILKIDREASSPFIPKGILSKGTFQIQGGGHAIGVAADDISENIIVLAVAQGESGLGVYDLKIPATPKLKFNSQSGYGSVVSLGDRFVYLGIANAVKVVDLGTQKEAQSIQAGSVWNLKVEDNLLYVASGEEGVKFFDVSDVSNPKQIAVIDTPGRARDVVIDGDYIYVADDRDDLQIIGKQ